MTYRVLDLFSGIGGFSLGLERTGGFETVAFCEIEPYSTAIWRQWETEPPLARVADGFPRGVVAEQIRALGNAVVPQIPELIGRAILSQTDGGACNG